MLIQKQTERACPVCGSSDAEILHTQRFLVPDELDVPDEFDVVCCSHCGVGFADAATAQARIDETYRDHSKYVDHGGDEVSPVVDDAPPPAEPSWDLDRLRSTAAYLASAVPDRSARTLDAGCATGALLGFLKAEGFGDLVGLDPSPEAVAIARRVHGVRAVAGSFTAPPPEFGTFGLVTLTHVFEHIADLDVAVTKLRELLDDDGLAYVEVPDARHYVGHLAAPFQDFNTEHINHFSLPTLGIAMAQAGFELVASGEKVIGCSATHTYPAIYGLWRRASGPVAATGVERDLSLVNGLAAYVDASAAHLRRIDAALREDLKGASAVVVWGAGQLGMKLLRESELTRAPIAAVVDGSTQKQGLHLGRWVVEAPARARELPDAPIVITSMLHDESIIATIRDGLGLPNRIIQLAR